jgi:uncharacterized protein YuzE
MKISYDKDIDALYIRLIEGKHECRTVRLNEQVALNIGEDERLVGIEILDAKEVLGAGKLPPLAIENLAVEAAGSLVREKSPKYGKPT